MTVFASLLVAVIGGVIYMVSTNAKLAEIGRVSYAMGLLAFLLQLSPQVVSLLGGK